MRSRNLWLASAALAGVLAAGQAVAQEAAPPSSTGEAATLEAVVVTAQKRAQDVQDVPISMEVLGAEKLEAMQISNFQSLQNYVPNLLVQPSPGNNAVFIRGFGSLPSNYAFDQSVSMYLDGVYGGRNRQFMAPMFDVERVEVMRGPQGALLGKNTAAGAVSIITAGPSRTPQAQVTGVYNFSREGGDLSGFVTGPLGEDFSGRLAMKYTKMAGYIANSATGNDDPRVDNFSARGSLRFQPNDRFDATAKLTYDRFTTLGTGQVRVNPITGGLTDRKNAASPFGVPEEDRQTSYNASVTANLALGDFTLTSVTGYSTFKDKKDTGGSAGNPETWLSLFTEDFDQLSQEIRLLSPTDGALEYIVGAYYDTGDYDLYNGSRYNLFGGAVAGQTAINFAQKAKTWSVFAQGTWRVTDDLRVLGSLRYTNNKKEATFRLRQVAGTPLPGVVPLDLPNALVPNVGSLDENNTDPSLTVQYDIAPRIMVYAAWGRGSKAGGFVSNTRTVKANQFQYGPERSTNYEVGVKSTLLGGRLMLNATLYQTEFKDLQVANYDPVAAVFVTKNAAAATSRGVEASADWLVAEGLRLAASVAYLDGKYDDFPGASCLAATPKPCTSENLGGTVMPGASKWSGNVQADWTHPIGDRLKVSATGVGSFRSRYFTSTDASPIYGTQRSYAKLDARVELADRDDRWALALVGKNLNNELTQSYSYLWSLSTPATAIQFLDETRTISLEARARF